MNNIEAGVIKHYGDAQLLSRILKAFEVAGLDRNSLQAADLAPVEAFHTGGKKATQYAIDKMSLNNQQHVLDVGCGIGGTVRHIAKQTACRVTGIDLTPEYIETARTLSELTGFDDRVEFKTGSALDMPFENTGFDAAISLHVAMNIFDRRNLYSEIARVLKPGAIFCLFDMMKKGHHAVRYPVPWAQSAQTSCLNTADETFELLDNAGFYIDEVDDRTDFARDFFKQHISAGREDLPGIHLLMGENAVEKLKNVLWNIENERIVPVQMIARRR
ncbi:MAG TPA: class I SAM-dependent methyltransferase [Gammaproteobacteria bacterium]|nr:class I SAM-dependent methyltransferase [Gammaproteobacteria bacterium]